MEFDRAELSMWRNVMDKGPERSWREHVGELHIAEGSSSMVLWGKGGNDKRGWRIRQTPHNQGPFSPFREFEPHPEVGRESPKGLEEGGEKVKLHFQTFTLATLRRTSSRGTRKKVRDPRNTRW